MRYLTWCCALLIAVSVGCSKEIKTANEPSKPPATAQAPVEPVLTRESRSAQGSGDKPSSGAGEVVELDGVTLTPRTDWTRKPASSSFVAAEFSLPRAAGDDADGRLTISTAGGSVEANIDRWKGQFQPEPKKAKQEVIDVNGLKVTIVDFSGDFNDQRGPFAPGEKRSNYRMIAAVIPLGSQLHFVKATGPDRTIGSHADAILEFIRTARPTK
jgi:hypothetical protein